MAPEHLVRLALKDKGEAIDFHRTEQGVRVCREDNCVDLKDLSGADTVALFSLLEDLGVPEGPAPLLSRESPAGTGVGPASDAIRRCYDIEDSQAAFDCVKQVTGNAKQEACPPRILLFTKPGCEPCEEERATRAADIAAGLIEEVSLATEEGRALADRLGIEDTPAILPVDCNGDAIELAGSV